MVASNNKEEQTKLKLLESSGWNSARYVHIAGVWRGGREDVRIGEGKNLEFKCLQGMLALL